MAERSRLAVKVDFPLSGGDYDGFGSMDSFVISDSGHSISLLGNGRYPLAVNLLPSSTVRVFPPPTCGFQCSALRLGPTPTMASADFCMSLPAPFEAGSTELTFGTHADLPGYDTPTFTLIPVGYTSQRSVQVSGFNDNGRLAPLQRLISASCSSGQRFAYSFLQIRSHPRHPCRLANSSPCRASRGLTPPSECALPGAP